MPEGPPVEISPRRVACPGHGEHLRAQWPAGFAVFSLTIFKAAVEGEALQRAGREVAFLPAGASIPPPTINLVTERRPLCYFVERAVIADALREMGTLSIGLCDVCGRSGFSGPYSIDMMGRVVDSRVCVDCACDAGERIHRAHPTGGVWHGEG